MEVLVSLQFHFLSTLDKITLTSNLISIGNRTEWSLIWSLIIRVSLTKSDAHVAGVRFVYRGCDSIGAYHDGDGNENAIKQKV